MRKRALQRASDLEADPVEHYTRLAEEFGHSRRGHYQAPDDSQPMSRSQFLRQPSSLFILSLLALFIVGGAQLWQLGVFDPLFAAKGATVDRSSKRWMLNGRAMHVADDRVTHTHEAEADEPEPAFTPVDDNVTSTN